MPATSISFRRVTQFVIPKGLVKITKANVPLGSIQRDSHTLTVGRVVFEKYKCQYTKDIIDDITVYDTNIEGYVEYNQYKKSVDFNIFYSSKQQILFSDATTPVTKKFLKQLALKDDVELDYQTIHLDMKNISSRMPQTRGIRFSTVDEGVTRKNFSGDEVDINEEAVEALQNDTAIQIIGTLDIEGRGRTVMISQAGTLMSFTSLVDMDGREYPMLEFSLEVLQEIGVLTL
ncbi:hypothetical protein FD51_GL003016 [Lacticaseibacillus zeae DSM 20178 = KCTC 3804]|uniref:Uncharacterized protein n=2 Tax=Lacticaseibacillus zeae TaxID=57037 RepID=A0A5R8LQK6_LACZE|nr:hypothetical protein [Lacticaseibacillus zeae]KRK12257.1 hypothetical protein FD51_GL003016 [Lacticaseibacillus zeae DSM 20178 = KCTC 3804]OLS09583.1 hypothetical protein AUQ39_05855 [Lacticaseibacillus casei]QVI31098.1 hypothetical protein KG087_09155 [Lacticaseibacillus zeae]TLF39501.1 hypothetical protein FEI14_12490 [Lacticaseibacillus zeae]